MKITALGRPFYNYPKSTVMNKRMSISAPKTMGADIFCFTGSLEKRASIIPAKNDTELAKKIEKFTQIEPTTTEIKKFKNGEIYVNINGDMSGKDVYLMPASNPNVNDNLMETYLKADAAKRAGAKRVIAVMPSFDYARQEKRMETGEPIAARLNM
ncbi:ribose-phosphate pyrophosphokinase-like domain-containing protein [bacterium]|nr:ribose-phosphate pyrophosphokinase-like domain-containing protein [bacterium]